MSEIDRLRREREQVREEIEREQERHLRTMVELRIRETRTEMALELLRSAANVSTMHTKQRSRGAAISAGKSTLGTRFQEALADANLSIPEWCASKGKAAPGVETVRAWSKPPERGGRQPSRAWADAIAKEFNDPALALASSWPSGIREE